MLIIFSDMIEVCLEVFIDYFTVYGDSFEECLRNLKKVLVRCEEKNLVLNWEKCHFMVTKGIVLSHIVSSDEIQVNKAKVELISDLPPPKCLKDIRPFLGHAGSIGGSSKISTQLHILCAICFEKTFALNGPIRVKKHSKN